MKRTLLRLLHLACWLSEASFLGFTPSLADPGRGATTLCYLWNNNASPTIGTAYEPNSTYSFNAQNRAGGISVTCGPRPGPIRSHALASAAAVPGALAAMCRFRHMDLVTTVLAMSKAGARADQISPRRSTAMAVVVQAEYLRTASLDLLFIW